MWLAFLMACNTQILYGMCGKASAGLKFCGKLKVELLLKTQHACSRCKRNHPNAWVGLDVWTIQVIKFVYPQPPSQVLSMPMCDFHARHKLCNQTLSHAACSRHAAIVLLHACIILCDKLMYVLCVCMCSI